jgi:hypothetical protein
MQRAKKSGIKLFAQVANAAAAATREIGALARYFRW